MYFIHLNAGRKLENEIYNLRISRSCFEYKYQKTYINNNPKILQVFVCINDNGRIIITAPRNRNDLSVYSFAIEPSSSEDLSRKVR